MKRLLPCFLMLLGYVCPSIASLADNTKTADGYLTTGEYATATLENYEKLMVMGGDSAVIDAWDYSRLEVYSTSLPLSLEGKRGVYDIHLNDNSTLLFSGGATQSLKLYDDSTATLKGGTINYITIYHRPVDSCYVTIICQDGWEWLYTSGKITGIKGLWKDGTAFQITLSNVGGSWPDTAAYINIIPEPASMLLLGLGGLLLRHRKK